MAKLFERDREILADLQAACDNYKKVCDTDWVRPLDCGGGNGSDHSYRLTKLARLGYAEAKQNFTWGRRGSRSYRITEKGAALLKRIKDERRAEEA